MYQDLAILALFILAYSSVDGKVGESDHHKAIADLGFEIADLEEHGAWGIE